MSDLDRILADPAAALAAVVETHPDLTVFGIKATTAADYAEGRAALARGVEEFTAAARWIDANMTPRHSMCLNRSSYGLKHTMEHDTGTYSTNGRFICAAVALGFAYRQIGTSLNCHFAAYVRRTAGRGESARLRPGRQATPEANYVT